MKDASLLDLLQADAQGLYQQFTDTLRLLGQVTNPQVRAIYKQDLEELWNRANELHATGALNSKTLPLVKIVLQRPASQWFVLHTNPSSQVVS